MAPTPLLKYASGGAVPGGHVGQPLVNSSRKHLSSWLPHGYPKGDSYRAPSSYAQGGLVTPQPTFGEPPAELPHDDPRAHQVPNFAGGGSVTPLQSQKNASPDNYEPFLPSLVRGWTAGLGGLPGDLEEAVRSLIKGGASPNSPVDKAVSEHSVLPTSEFFKDWLPGTRAPNAETGVAEDLSTSLGGVGITNLLRGAKSLPAALKALMKDTPTALPAATRAAPKGVAAARDAVEAAEAVPALSSVVPAAARQLPALAPDLPAVAARVANEPAAPVGALEAAALAPPATAAPTKGALQQVAESRNWAPFLDQRDANVGHAATDSLQQYLDVLSPLGQDNPVSNWTSKQLKRYLQNDYGAAHDPLLKLETEGKLHVSPAQLEDYIGELGLPPEGRSPWAQLAHGSLAKLPPEHVKELWTEAARDAGSAAAHPAWLDKLAPDANLLYMGDPHMDRAQFGHVLDYLTNAVSTHEVHKVMKAEGKLDQFAREAPEAAALVARNLHLSPQQLTRTSVPDAVAKTAEWNKMLESLKTLEDTNKGVKSVLKAYPETGHQWVELAPEGLKAEGSAMKHCVGGYCSEVEGGNTRILSLRDAAGKPQVTVELRPRHKLPGSDEPLNNLLNDDMAAKLGAEQIHDIIQIKGPSNRKPSAENLAYVQDLVKGGVGDLKDWGRVNDLQNAGLFKTVDYFDTPRLAQFAEAGISLPRHTYSTASEMAELQKQFYDKVTVPNLKERGLYYPTKDTP